jgi:DNA (cytosine-5)-methyltransferase 1
LNELALFAGAGGGILGGKLLGWRTVCAVEWEAYPASVLCARQNDGFLPTFPIWDDVQTFDGKPWRGIVDVVSGGFPCQDISAAGKGAGIDGERSGMWGEMARIICEVRPQFVFVENSPVLTSRGLGRVLGDLAAMGFDARWGVLGAADVGAVHQRDRIWIVGKNTDSNSIRSQKNSNEEELCRQTKNIGSAGRFSEMGCKEIWARPCPIGASPMGVGNGVAGGVDRLKAIGNGQVPLCAATAWRILSE